MSLIHAGPAPWLAGLDACKRTAFCTSPIGQEVLESLLAVFAWAITYSSRQTPSLYQANKTTPTSWLGTGSPTPCQLHSLLCQIFCNTPICAAHKWQITFTKRLGCAQSSLSDKGWWGLKAVCFVTRSENHRKRQTQQKKHPTGYETDFGHLAEIWWAGSVLIPFHVCLIWELYSQ